MIVDKINPDYCKNMNTDETRSSDKTNTIRLN